MKIIQSFAQFDDGNHYVNGKLNGTEIYLNFYTFLLSYLTLKKYYGSVTMYCNKKAYDTFIQYIPYDEIIIKENKYTQNFWSAYKLDVIADMKETFIHVDSDVFIFDDVFRPFIDSTNKYDIIVQDLVSYEKLNNFYNFNIAYVNDNIDFYIDNEIYKKDSILKCFSCGSIGMNLKVRDIYIKNVFKIYDKMYKDDEDDVGMILEELTLYLTAIKNEFSWCEILTDDNIYGTSANNRYTHMWFNTKYILENIILIKNKIKKDFNEYYHLIDLYEKSILGKEIYIYKKNRDELSVIKFEI
jgi:choline kinase